MCLSALERLINRAGKHSSLQEKDRGCLVSEHSISPGKGSQHHCSGRNHLHSSETEKHNRMLPLQNKHAKKLYKSLVCKWSQITQVKKHKQGREIRMCLGAEIWVYLLTPSPDWASSLIWSKREKWRRVAWNACHIITTSGQIFILIDISILQNWYFNSTRNQN